MTIRIEPYKQGSKAAKALSRRCGILRVTAKQIQKHRTFDTVLNWGNSERRFNNARYINNPEAVAIASDKLRSAGRLGEAHVAQPDYTTDRIVATRWLEQTDVCCRRFLRASGGRGLDIIRSSNSNESSDSNESSTNENGTAGYDGLDGRGRGRSALIDAPMYTKYVKKADEYRIHVVRDTVIDIQQKRKRQEVPNSEINYQIRNACNGWVFCRDDVTCPDVCLSLARRAVSALSLDFGAVDIGYNRHEETAVVYEVNTAPGLEGTTLDKYYAAFREILPEIGSGTFATRRSRTA